MTRGRPVEPETRTEALRLFEAGKSRNAIARELGIGAATVTKIIGDAGQAFDREQTAAAVKAHTVDLAALRLRLAEKMGTAAERMLDKLDDPYLVYNFGGKDNDYNEHTLDSAPVEVRRSVIVTGGIAFDKITRVVERDPDTSGATSVLSALETGLRAVVAELDAGVTTDDSA